MFELSLLILLISGVAATYFIKTKRLYLEKKLQEKTLNEYARQLQKKIEDLKLEEQARIKQIEDLKKKYEQNPSYETQLMMADLLSGNGLFKIERIETENLFYRRQ